MNSNDAMAMNRSLSKKEKQAKLIEARRRAILWSEREIRKRQLKTQAQIEDISLSETTDPAPPSLASYSEIVSSNENTVSSLQKTIQDLTIQRQELDITIKVLTNHLNHLLNKSDTFKGHKRTKHYG